MAYNKIINIKHKRHLRKAINYAANAEKTVDGGERFVSGINCFPQAATEKMLATKERFDKEDGRIAYHVIQSFPAGEVTPELAHEIAMQYAERWLSDYEVVIGTHLDKGHTHNHIIFNSVSCKTGLKFHISKNDFYEKLYGISNEICRSYGLSIPLDFVDSSRMSYDEYLQRHDGKRTLKQIAKDDIESCIGNAASVGDLYTRLENMGYMVTGTGKYPKIMPPDGRKAFRLATLGYTDDVLLSRITSRPPPSKRAIRPKRYYGKRKLARPKARISSMEARYIHYLHSVGTARMFHQASVIPVTEYRKFDYYKRQLRFVAQNGLRTMADVQQRKNDVTRYIGNLREAGRQLRNERDKYKPLFEAHAIYERYYPIRDKQPLDQERRGALNKAMEVIRQYGYEKNPDAIQDVRAMMADGIEKNRKEMFAQKRALRSLHEVEECAGQMRDRLLQAERSRQQARERDKVASKTHVR